MLPQALGAVLAGAFRAALRWLGRSAWHWFRQVVAVLAGSAVTGGRDSGMCGVRRLLVRGHLRRHLIRRAPVPAPGQLRCQLHGAGSVCPALRFGHAGPSRLQQGSGGGCLAGGLPNSVRRNTGAENARLANSALYKQQQLRARAPGRRQVHRGVSRAVTTPGAAPDSPMDLGQRLHRARGLTQAQSQPQNDGGGWFAEAFCFRNPVAQGRAMADPRLGRG